MPQASRMTPKTGPLWPEGTSPLLLAEPGIQHPGLTGKGPPNLDLILAFGRTGHLFRYLSLGNTLNFKPGEAVTAVTWGWRKDLPLLAFTHQMALETYFTL